MAKNRNNNDNNNNINNNGILEKYLGEEALNSLKELKSPNKKSAETKQDKNGNQSQIEAELGEIINKIKNHTPVSQETKDKIKYINTSIELTKLD